MCRGIQFCRIVLHVLQSDLHRAEDFTMLAIVTVLVALSVVALSTWLFCCGTSKSTKKKSETKKKKKSKTSPASSPPSSPLIEEQPVARPESPPPTAEGKKKKKKKAAKNTAADENDADQFAEPEPEPEPEPEFEAEEVVVGARKKKKSGKQGAKDKAKPTQDAGASQAFAKSKAAPQAVPPGLEDASNRQRKQFMELGKELAKIEELEKRLRLGERLTGQQLAKMATRGDLEAKQKDILVAVAAKSIPKLPLPPKSGPKLPQPKKAKGKPKDAFSEEFPEWARVPDMDWSADAAPAAPAEGSKAKKGKKGRVDADDPRYRFLLHRQDTDRGFVVRDEAAAYARLMQAMAEVNIAAAPGRAVPRHQAENGDEAAVKAPAVPLSQRVTASEPIFNMESQDFPSLDSAATKKQAKKKKNAGNSEVSAPAADADLWETTDDWAAEPEAAAEDVAQGTGQEAEGEDEDEDEGAREESEDGEDEEEDGGGDGEEEEGEEEEEGDEEEGGDAADEDEEEEDEAGGGEDGEGEEADKEEDDDVFWS